MRRGSNLISFLVGGILLLQSMWAVSSSNSQDFHVNSLKDIPAKDVNCIFHDSKGFMWIGTLDGLHRFDGYSYKTYRINPEGNSISSNLIISVDEDSKGNIWIGTYGKGICKLNPETDIFTSYENAGDAKNGLPNDVTALLVDDQDYIWTINWFGITRVGLDSTLSDVTEIDQIQIDTLNNNDGSLAVKSIFQDKEKNIWVGTNAFTVRLINPYQDISEIEFESFNVNGETFSDFDDGVLVGGVQINAITRKNENEKFEVNTIANVSSLQVLFHENKIWSGNRTGLRCFEKTGNQQWDILVQFQKDFSESSLNSNITTSLTNDDVGQIWFGTRGGGINVISTRPKRFQHYKHSVHPGSVANNLVMCVFEDSHENLWVGTEEQGASILPKGAAYSEGFRHLMVNNFGNENRVYAFEETLTPGLKNRKSIIWSGTSHPKFLAAFDSETLEELQLPAEISTIGHVFALENQNDSTLWVGTYSEGLWRLRLDENGEISNFRNFNPGSDEGVLSFIIRSIFKDSQGNIWVGTDKGINLIERDETLKENPVFKVFSLSDSQNGLSHDYILQIMESQNQTMWIGTMGGGLIKGIKTENDEYTFTTVTTEEGLPNNTIKTIVEDEQGYLWLSSNKGITRYNPNDGTLINYNEDDGLQDLDFSEICGLMRKNGDLFFGGINGFNVFRSERIESDRVMPRLYFTDFQILNKEVRAGELVDGRLILDKTIEYTESLELDYKQNSFSIGFVGVQYNSPQQNNYRYILEGFDKEWYKASPEYRMAKYTNIPDGDYIFKVTGANSENLWINDPIELHIKIRSPLYRSGLAILLYVLLVLVIGIIVYRITREITQRRRDVLLANIEKERVEEISKLKLQFFTNISHEFRTPLSLINAPLDQLMKEGQGNNSKNQQYNLQLIKHNVGLMMRLVNQLLDFRKLDQNKLKLKPSSQSLNDFLENIFLAFEVYAKQKNISYHFQKYKGGDDIWIDVDKMEKVVYNLLSNAFKYTNEGGRVLLKVDADLNSNQYIISVSDTGIGIEKDEEIHIFERYYQADNKKTRNISGTGIGLALAKGFVDLHKGEIGFYPNVDAGTVFYVKLRMGNAHYTTDILTETQELNSMAAPKYQSPVEVTEEVENLQKHQDLPKMLVVEDNFDLRKQVKNIFRKDYQIIEAEDGEMGLKLCREKQPDIVVTDVMMPKMDGLEMCNRIKEDEETSHIPVMLLTAKNTDETIIEGYEIGADGYVAKPFNVDVLISRVKSLVVNREQLRKRFQKEIEINPKIISNTPADSKFLDKILELIEANLSNSEYSVEQLSEDYGVSRIYLNRKIKALTGETTIEFVRNIKLKHAAELLKQGRLNVSEVAWEVGYNDIRTFRKRFKEKFEFSPSEFAKQHKE